MHLGAVAGSLLGLSALMLSIPSTPTAQASPTESQRIMVYGDSISQGSEGDWTWRYRLWQHLVDDGADVDFVGPATDVWPQSSSYADPDFDQDHASRWGANLTFPHYRPAEVAATYRPAVVVVLLGLNDLTFLEETPEQVEELMRTTIASLREADPGVDIVLTRLPNTDIAGVPETNSRFSAVAAELDDASERVVIAAADAGFIPSTPDHVQDTWDQVHPSARGELKIAAAVADALAELGVGTPHLRPLPRLPLGPRRGADLEASGGDASAALTWTSSPGTTSEVLWQRDLTTGTAWVQRSVLDASSSATITGLRNGHQYALRIRPAKGWALATDVSSAIVRVTPRAPAPARPRDVSAASRVRGALVRWHSARLATRYRVAYRVARAGSAWRYQHTTTLSQRLGNLKGGTDYVVRVQAVNDGTRSPWSSSLRVRALRAG